MQHQYTPPPPSPHGEGSSQFITPASILVSVLTQGTRSTRNGRLVVSTRTTLGTLAQRIRTSETLATRTAALRAILAEEGRDGRYASQKLVMPAIIPASSAPAGSLVKGLSPAQFHTRLYGYDIDEDREHLDLVSLRAALIDAPGTVMVGVSCAGDGLYALIAGPLASTDTEYTAQWSAIAAGMPAGAANSDQSKTFTRLRFLAHDPELWLATAVQPLPGAQALASSPPDTGRVPPSPARPPSAQRPIMTGSPTSPRQGHRSTDWGYVIATIALETFGEPTTRRGDEWRYGNHGSLVVNVGGAWAGRWKSWETGGGGGAVDLLQEHLGLDRQAAWQWLRDRRLIDLSPASPSSTASSHPGTPRAGVAPHPHGPDAPRLAIAQALRTAAEEISADPDHPARRWLAHRHLWRPEVPLPSAVKWVPATVAPFRGLHQGAGSIAVIMAQPGAWTETWPNSPTLTAIHLVSIRSDGTATLDRPEDQGGKGKRFYGLVSGSVAILGNPLLAEATASVRVIEGLADGLALASRFEGPVIAALGTPQRLAKDITLLEWLATSPYGVVIHADADAPGQAAARALRRALHAAGVQVRAVLPPEGTGKDSADIAKNSPFLPLSNSWVDYASTLREMHPAWPCWEIARQADIATTGGHNDR